MADTARTLAALQALLADNTSGDISAQDVRDFLVSAYQPQGVCDFRLGLEDGVFVSTSDQTGKSAVYLNPGGRGNRLCLSDGSSLVQMTLPKLALGGLTGLTSGRNYDVFGAYSTPTHSSTNTSTDVVTWSANPGWTTGTYVIVTSTGSGLTAGTDYWYNRASSTTGTFHTSLANAIAGTNKVDLTGNVTQALIGVFADLGPTWNTGGGSDTARGTGAGSTALTTLNGVSVNSVSVTGSIGGGTVAASAGVYVGTVRTTGTTTVEDSVLHRFVWNHHNRRRRHLVVQDATNTWTYATATWRQARAQSTNQVDYVCGFAEDAVVAEVQTYQQSTVSAEGESGVGVDRTSGNDAQAVLRAYSPGTSGTRMPQLARYRGIPGAGYHYLAWVEYAGSGATITFCGDDGQAEAPSALDAEVMA